MRHAFLALTNPSPGREAEFNAWYDTYHLKEVIRYGTGMRGGRRFRLADTQRPGPRDAQLEVGVLHRLGPHGLGSVEAALKGHTLTVERVRGQAA